MVNILTHIIQIIMLSSRTNTFLRIDCTLQSRHFQGGVASSQKERFVLIHTRIGKEEGGIIVGDARGGFPVGVAVLFFEELDEGGAHFGHGPCWVRGELGLFFGGRHGGGDGGGG